VDEKAQFLARYYAIPIEDTREILAELANTRSLARLTDSHPALPALEEEKP